MIGCVPRSTNGLPKERNVCGNDIFLVRFSLGAYVSGNAVAPIMHTTDVAIAQT
jgi:hypothetical protein